MVLDLVLVKYLAHAANGGKPDAEDPISEAAVAILVFGPFPFQQFQGLG